MGFADVNTKDFEAFASKVNSRVKAKIMYKTIGAEMQKLSGKLLDDVKTITPVGKSQNLKRAWRNSSLHYESNRLFFDLSNNMEYASFVEYGHRTPHGHGQGWVDGQFFMRDTMRDYEKNSAEFWQKQVDKALREIIDD